MFQDYRVYLLNLRNNLIQCGVSIQMNPIDTYEEAFYESDRLRQLLWYYSVVSIGGFEGGLPDYFMPLTGYYKEKMRGLFYSEFQSVLKDYKVISRLAYLSGDVDYSTVVDALKSNEEIDLSDESVAGTEEGSVETEGVASEASEIMADSAPEATLDNIDGYVPVVPYTAGGTFLDDVVRENIGDSMEGNLEEDSLYAQHGTYLDDLYEELLEGDCNFATDSVYLNKVEKEYVDHGTYLDDLSEEDTMVYSDHGVYLEDVLDSIESEVISQDDIQYDENGFELIEETGQEESQEGIVYDENGFEIVEEDEYQSESEEDEVQYDENGFEIVYEDEYQDDSDGDGIQYDENGFELVEEDENYIDDSDVDNYAESSSYNSTVSYNEGMSAIPTPAVNISNAGKSGNEDLSDLLQVATNSILTKGKKFIAREKYKLRNMDRK